jgi:hypothetical protein
LFGFNLKLSNKLFFFLYLKASHDTQQLMLAQQSQICGSDAQGIAPVAWL